MKKTYMYLTKEDKTRLQKLAQSKQLSLSTCADIMFTHLYIAVDHEKYYNKGQFKTCIKPRNTIKQPINTIIITNVVYAYLHAEALKDFPNKDFYKKALRHIQSDMDKTYDANYQKNIIIRELYKANKILKGTN